MQDHTVGPPDFGPSDHRFGWVEAARLYRRLVEGGMLLPMPNPVIVPRDGEKVYAMFDLEFALWDAGVDEVVEKMKNEVINGRIGAHLFAAGGLLAGGPPGAIAGAAVDKFRARRKAKKMREPQWASIIPTKVILTDNRTLLWLDGQYRTLPHSEIMQVNVDPSASSVTLELDDRPRTRLRGPAAMWYGVALASLVYPPATFAALPTFASFVAPPNKP